MEYAVKITRILLFVALCVGLAAPAFAQRDPVDRNYSGALLGGGLYFGQGVPVGEGSSGMAWFTYLDVGFGNASDTWNRFEGALELSTGTVKFSPEFNGVKTKYTYDVKMQVLAKGSYGYSLGSHVFSMFSVGAGAAFGDVEAKDFNTSVDASSFVGQLGWGVVVPMADNLFLDGGLNWRFMTVNPDKGNDFQVNLPLIKMGMRFLLAPQR